MDKLSLMASFVAVVEQGSFTEAAKHLGKTKAIVSRQVSQLEALLQQRLINRTTRTLAVTEMGRAMYERCCRILDDVALLETAASGDPRGIAGRLRINAPQTFGELQLMPRLLPFMRRYPDLQVELRLTDRYVDLIDEGFDVALRIGQMEDSSMIARKIGESELLLVASPALVARHPAIATPSDLTALPCIHDSNWRGGTKWRFGRDGEIDAIKVTPVLTVNSAVAAGQAAASGLGVAISPDFAVRPALDDGTLVRLLPEYQLATSGIYALYPHRQHLAPKVRAFIDYLQDHPPG